MSFNSRLYNNFIITRFTMLETDPMKKQYESNFIIDSDVSDVALRNRIHEMADNTLNGLSVTNNRISGTLGNIMSYKAGHACQEAYVPGGWEEPRIRWELEMIVNGIGNNEKTLIMDGYSDYLGIEESSGGGIHLDDDMVLYINSIKSVSVRRAGTSTRNVVSDNRQLLFNDDKNLSKNTIRPVDILNLLSFADKASNIFKVAAQDQGFYDVSRLGNKIDPLADDDIEFATPNKKTINDRVMTNNRENNNPVRYIGSQLNSFISSKREYDNLDETERDRHNDHYDGAIQSVNDDDIANNNPLLAALNTLANVLAHGKITIRQLHEFDVSGNLTKPNVTSFIPANNYYDTCNDICNGNWNEATHQANVARTIRDSMPSILFRAGLEFMRFHVLRDPSGMTDDYVLVPSPTAFFNTIDHDDTYNEFAMQFRNEYVDAHDSKQYVETRFLNEILPMITKNFQIEIDVVVEMNLKGDCVIAVTMEDYHVKTYGSASYADNKISPVIANGNTSDDKVIGRAMRSISENLYKCGDDVIQSLRGKVMTNNNVRPEDVL